MSKKYVELKYEDLTKEILEKENNSILKIKKNGIKFYFNLKFKSDNKHLVVFSNGAIDRKKSKPPVFMRHSWYEEVDANCIFIDDRTLHGTTLYLGWGAGVPKHYYLKSISDIIIKITEFMNIEPKNITYYGSSAGGTMSIMLATFHRGTCAIANNPQAFAGNYLKGQVVQRISEKLYNNLPKEEILQKYGDRFSIVDCFKKNEYIPKIIYIFNHNSFTDYDKQYLPLIEKMKKEKLSLEKFQFEPYYNSSSGHSPLSKEETLEWINRRFND